MSISPLQSSQVLIQEVNLSQVLVGTSSSVAAQVIVSNQGPTVPTLMTNPQTYMTNYGKPNPQVSFDVYCGLDYFKVGSQLWSLRVVDTATALYASVLMWTNGTNTYLTPVTMGVNLPTEPDWAAILPPGSGNEAIALFYPLFGPGQYGDSIAIDIVSGNLQPPTGLTATAYTTGGFLSPSTYTYQVSALSSAGQTLASNAA